MNSYIQILIIAVVVFLSGCANWSTVDRHTDLPSNYDNEGRERQAIAVHLDAEQRVMVYKAFGAYCAEPSPDALTAFGSAFGASVSGVKGADAVSVSQSFNELAQNIGLRTQSVQLMRDSMYRLCELYFNKALKGETVTSLFRNYQNIMIGVLAIEQLTEPLKSDQGSLVAQVTIESDAQLGSTIESVEKIVEKEQVALKAYTESQSATQAAEKIVEDTTNLVSSAGADATEEQKKAAEDAKKILETKEADEFQKKSFYEILKEVRLAAAEKLGATNASTASSSDSKSSSNQYTRSAPSNVNAPHVAYAVNSIIRNIVARDYTRETCLEIMVRVMDGDYHRSFKKSGQPMPRLVEKTIEDTVATCQTVLLQPASDYHEPKFTGTTLKLTAENSKSDAGKKDKSISKQPCSTQIKHELLVFGPSVSEIDTVKNLIGGNALSNINGIQVSVKRFSIVPTSKLGNKASLRYFHAEDKTMASALVNELKQLTGVEISLADLSSVLAYQSKVCPGYFELWLKKTSP